MQNTKSMRILFLAMILLAANIGKAQISIFVPESATEIEYIAANELQSYLSQIYPSEEFMISKDGSGLSEKLSIYLGTQTSRPELVKSIDTAKLKAPESYVVTKSIINGQETGIILGADEAGVMYGVYGLLEKLGCGFFLSFETLPPPSKKPFNFDDWDLANHPVTPIRSVFNWHNFLSGCSGWDLEHWTKWIAQSQKCGYNTIMVHAYGNNPMFTFTFNGKEKPVGYLTSSAKGRDWSVNHVNDIRRLPGGSIFKKAVFGCKPAQAPDDERVEAAQDMMKKAFEYARQRGVKVNFAVDFDIPSCNPASLVTTLDKADRFLIRDVWIARPDTTAGYEYYKVQAKAMVSTYPQVSTVTLWRRRGGHSRATWPTLHREEMPETWKQEYDAFIEKDPEAATLHQSIAAFGMAKVAKAWRKALNELGRPDIELATGSWGFAWVPATAKFFPKEVKLIPLDYEVANGSNNLRNSEMMKDIDEAIEDGRMIPIIWAHHDDGEYLGAPLRIYKQFSGKLKTWGAGGFGIIHWMTHPLDIYFASHSRQTWALTQDEDLATTGQWMASRCFGSANQEVMGRYLASWANDMPYFGRETGDFFIDRPMSKFGPLEETRSGCNARLRILEQADISVMTEAQKKRHQFFIDYENFVSDFFQTEYTFEKAKAALGSGNAAQALKLIRTCNPETLVERYANITHDVGISRGEEGLVVSMNTRWIPHYVRFRQQLGIEPVRYNYGPTSHDHLAQACGIFTFYVSSNKALWQTFGKEETGFDVFTMENVIPHESTTAFHADVCKHGIRSSEPISITFAPILVRDSQDWLKREDLPAGDYKLTLIMAEPTAAKVGERIMKLEWATNKAVQTQPETSVEIDIFKLAAGRNRAIALDYPVTLAKPGNINVTLLPVKGEALICGVILERIKKK